MSLLSRLFGSRKDSPKGAPTHEVEVHFSYGSNNFQHLYALEDVLRRVIADAAVGHYEGHDVDADGDNGYFYIYGPDAEAIFRAIHPVLSNCSFTSNAKITLLFGPRRWKTPKRVIQLPS